MANSTVILFTHYGLGQGPEELQHKMAVVFLTLLRDQPPLPSQILFYTDGVKLVCQGSPVLEELRVLQEKGVELIVCSTCLGYFGLVDRLKVGIAGGMPDILEAIARAGKVVSV